MTDETEILRREVEATKKQDRGQRAKDLLENELLKEAFATLRKDYTDAWLRTHFKDSDGRERLWQAVQIVNKIGDHLSKVVNDGKIATRDLSQIQFLKK